MNVALDCSAGDDTDQATCEAIDDVSADLIADGGDFGQLDAVEDVDYLVVGEATFTPTGGGTCSWTAAP